MNDSELVSAAIAKSGLSVSRFAREILTRDPRTVFRWLKGPTETLPNALPQVVRARLIAMLAEEPTTPPP